MPFSSSTISLQTARMKARSCETSTNAPWYSAQVGLQALDGGEVEVVGRLVHAAGDRAGAPAPWPAPAGRARRPTACRPARAEIALGEADVGGEPLHAPLELVAAAALVALLQLAVAGELVGVLPSARRASSAAISSCSFCRSANGSQQRLAAACRRRTAPATGAGRRRACGRARARRRCRPRDRRPGGAAPSTCRCRSARPAPADRPDGSAARRRRGCRCPDNAKLASANCARDIGGSAGQVVLELGPPPHPKGARNAP